MSNQEILAPIEANEQRQKHAGGRPKGSQNKLALQVREMVLEALHGVGGADYLMACALMPATASAFLTLCGKAMPPMHANAGVDEGAIEVRVIERRIVSVKRA